MRERTEKKGMDSSIANVFENLGNFPSDILNEIINALSIEDILRVREVNKKFLQISSKVLHHPDRILHILRTYPAAQVVKFVQWYQQTPQFEALEKAFLEDQENVSPKNYLVYALTTGDNKVISRKTLCAKWASYLHQSADGEKYKKYILACHTKVTKLCYPKAEAILLPKLLLNEYFKQVYYLKAFNYNELHLLLVFALRHLLKNEVEVSSEQATNAVKTVDQAADEGMDGKSNPRKFVNFDANSVAALVAKYLSHDPKIKYTLGRDLKDEFGEEIFQLLSKIYYDIVSAYEEFSQPVTFLLSCMEYHEANSNDKLLLMNELFIELKKPRKVYLTMAGLSFEGNETEEYKAINALNLSGMNLQNCIFKNFNLHHVDFSNSDCKNITFSNVKCSDSIFRNVYARDAVLNDAKFHFCLFQKNCFANATMTDVSIDYMKIDGIKKLLPQQIFCELKFTADKKILIIPQEYFVKPALLSNYLESVYQYSAVTEKSKREIAIAIIQMIKKLNLKKDGIIAYLLNECVMFADSGELPYSMATTAYALFKQRRENQLTGRKVLEIYKSDNCLCTDEKIEIEYIDNEYISIADVKNENQQEIKEDKEAKETKEAHLVKASEPQNKQKPSIP